MGPSTCMQALSARSDAEDGCPDVDYDQDGIPDTLDKCVEVAEDKDDIDDDDGCPEEDADGDGIADVDDKCPKEKGVRSEEPGRNG